MPKWNGNPGAVLYIIYDNPSKALSDANTVLDIKYLENILYQAKKVHELRLELKEQLSEDNVHPK